MLKLKSFATILVVFAIVQPVLASDQARLDNALKEYFNQATVKVQQTSDPEAKRQILNDSFRKFFAALDQAKTLPNLGITDINALAEFREQAQEKYDELNGLNGYGKVSDKDLNDFARYVQQDLEQADRELTITISLTTLLLGIIILLLLAD